ncbi:AMP-binding protein [Hansschlegelia plantiphila]|uniref:AMP-dependent synthetase/ligase domain-containing protein n=1 Tax=Hansschlegelia plantiphila TaxID=374655 RepID=A0A9W6IZU3_9HYPH|nr:AMP-binding protein [Hansschlegelia plantiphila]GLK68221.1 hypothetical protein GCM10008179_18590 [Hansschlegelia plantiphila]
MRLEPFAHDPMPNPVAGGAKLDDVLALNARRRPDEPALFDPALPFDGAWREVDRAVSALAEVFSHWRLGEDAVVGVQLGSRFEGALTCLALWRAGLIPAMLPIAWRRRETARALATVGAAAVVAATEAGGAALAEIACEIAAGLDTLRFVGSFGDASPDGATPLDEALTLEAGGSPLAERPDDAADHIAIITFEAGGAPAPRSHNDLVAACLTPLLAAQLTDRSKLLSTLDLGGLAGLATGLAPWLTTGAVACFHQPSTTAAFAAAAEGLGATHIALPGRAADRLIADGALGETTPEAVIAVWRAPDGGGAAKSFNLDGAIVVDAIMIGELGVFAAARPSEHRHAALPLGRHAPEGLDALIDLRVLQDGRLFVRGPACPQAAFPAAPGAPALPFAADGYIETGLAGIADRVAGRATLGGRRRGVAQIGGLAVSSAETLAAAMATGLPGGLEIEDDALFGSRLALTLSEDSKPFSAEQAATILEAAGFGPALAPAIVRAEPSRRTA